MDFHAQFKAPYRCLQNKTHDMEKAVSCLQDFHYIQILLPLFAGPNYETLLCQCYQRMTFLLSLLFLLLFYCWRGLEVRFSKSQRVVAI